MNSHSRSRTVVCASLSTSASLLSVSISAVAGWSRGDVPVNSAFWALLGMLATVAAHLILVAARIGSWPLRALTWALWAGCMIFVTFSHASYFMASQQASGELRAIAVAEPLSPAHRPLSQVMVERSRVESELAELARVGCSSHCTASRLRLTALKSHVAALDQEVQEVRQLLSGVESHREAQVRARRDPALGALSAWSALPLDSLQLVLGILVGVLLDGVPCVCWALLLCEPSNRPNVVTATSVTTEVSNASPVHPEPEVQGDSRKLDALLAEVRAAIDSGRVRNTVRALRQHLACSQDTAVTLSRALKVPA